MRQKICFLRELAVLRLIDFTRTPSGMEGLFASISRDCDIDVRFVVGLGLQRYGR
jgi:hypothetical protein